MKGEQKTKTISRFFLAGMISIITSLILIIIFALCIKWFTLKDTVITPINMVIKTVSIFLGMLILLKERKNGLAKGVIFGALYSLLAFIIFSLLLGSFSFGINMLVDFIFCAIVGGLSGIILVNIKK